MKNAVEAARVDIRSPAHMLKSALVAVMIANFACVLWPNPPNRDMAIHEAARFLRCRLGDDSWLPMHAAMKLLATEPGVRLYDRLFFHDHVKFQYPPSSLLPLKFLALFPEPIKSSNVPLNVVCWISVWASAFFSARILVRTLRMDGLSRRETRRVQLLTVVLTLCFYPVVRAGSLG